MRNGRPLRQRHFPAMFPKPRRPANDEQDRRRGRPTPTAKTDPRARTGVVVKTRDARSRDMLAMLAVAGSGADARPANPSAIKAAVNA